MPRKNQQDYTTVSVHKSTKEDLQTSLEWLEKEHQTTYSMSSFIEFILDYFQNTYRD